MSEWTTPPADEPPRHWFIQWVHTHTRQAIILGVVLSFLIFAIIRGFLGDEPALVERTEVAKERWALIVASQESFYEINGRYTDDPDALDGVADAVQAPNEELFLVLKLEEDGARVAMTLSGNTIRLRRTLSDGQEADSSCQILQAHAGDC
jgi:hypothetical protein